MGAREKNRPISGHDSDSIGSKDQGANKTAATQRRPTTIQANPKTVEDEGEPNEKPQGRELSPYDKALLEGKTHLEAMYAQASPVAKPKDNMPSYLKPNPLDAFSDPVDAPPRAIPQPSWNP
jgi:hypothetical protein